MIMTDPYVTQMFGPPKWLEYGVQAAMAAGVLLVGKWRVMKHKAALKTMAAGAGGARVEGD